MLKDVFSPHVVCLLEYSSRASLYLAASLNSDQSPSRASAQYHYASTTMLYLRDCINQLMSTTRFCQMFNSDSYMFALSDQKKFFLQNLRVFLQNPFNCLSCLLSFTGEWLLTSHFTTKAWLMEYFWDVLPAGSPVFAQGFWSSVSVAHLGSYQILAWKPALGSVLMVLEFILLKIVTPTVHIQSFRKGLILPPRSVFLGRLCIL